MSPTPTLLHQSVSTEILSQIWSYVKKRKLGICLPTIDVFFDSKNVFEPDILFISDENLNIIKEDKIKGSPDLIIEVLSPGNRRHDTEKKKAAYEKFGVKEYFIVDPETKDTITWYLINNKYRKQISKKGKIKSKLLKKTFSF